MRTSKEAYRQMLGHNPVRLLLKQNFRFPDDAPRCDYDGRPAKVGTFLPTQVGLRRVCRPCLKRLTAGDEWSGEQCEDCGKVLTWDDWHEDDEGIPLCTTHWEYLIEDAKAAALAEA